MCFDTHNFSHSCQVLELGSWALSREAFWFCLCAVKSSTVQKIGGMSLLMPHLLDLFRMPFDTSSGIYLRHADWRVMFFGQVALHIGDEVACKSVLGVKGAAGTVFCACCQNGVDFKSALQDHDDRLIPSTCLEFSRFRQHTTESVRDAHQLLRERHEVETAAGFKLLEQSLGFNWHERSLLSIPRHQYLLSATMFDWFHIYFVHGVASVHAGLTIAELHKGGHQAQDIALFVQAFVMPRRLQGARPKACLEKRSNKTDPLKGSASETINFLLILRCYILQFVLDDCSPGLRRCCQSFLHLCSITDTLLQSWKNQTLGCNTPCHITSCHFSSWTCDWSVERCFEPCRIAVCFMDVMGRSCYIGCMSWDGHAASCHNDMSLVSPHGMRHGQYDCCQVFNANDICFM